MCVCIKELGENERCTLILRYVENDSISTGSIGYDIGLIMI